MRQKGGGGCAYVHINLLEFGTACHDYLPRTTKDHAIDGCAPGPLSPSNNSGEEAQTHPPGAHP